MSVQWVPDLSADRSLSFADREGSAAGRTCGSRIDSAARGAHDHFGGRAVLSIARPVTTVRGWPLANPASGLGCCAEPSRPASTNLRSLLTAEVGTSRMAPASRPALPKLIRRKSMLDRRSLIKGAGAGVYALGTGIGFSPLEALALDTVTLPFENGERPLVKYPQKRPMIGLTSRPPQLETPFSVFNESVITPNDAFFVRYHLAGLPLDIDPETFRVEVKGKVDKPLKLSLAELKAMPSIEIVAVNQCSGNSRGLFVPRVAGGQSGNGAMGNARWKGVPLKA